MELTQNLPKEININMPKIANNALNFGLKAILPDFIEEDIIQIKDSFINEGFEKGLEEAKEKAEEVWKSVKGVFTGEFDTVGEIQKLIQKNGILDTASDLVDKITKLLLSKKIINKTTYNLIKTGKKEIINALEGELNNYYKVDNYDFEGLSEQIEKWQKNYNDSDYESMEKTAKTILNILDKVDQIEAMITKARNIQKVQKYIQEKGSKEKLTKAERKLIEAIN